MFSERNYYLHPTDYNKYGDDVDVYYPDTYVRPNNLTLRDWMMLYPRVCARGWTQIQDEEWMRIVAEAERWDWYGEYSPKYGNIIECDCNGVPVERGAGQGAEGGNAGVGTPPRAASDIA